MHTLQAGEYGAHHWYFTTNFDFTTNRSSGRTNNIPDSSTYFEITLLVLFLHFIFLSKQPYRVNIRFSLRMAKHARCLAYSLGFISHFRHIPNPNFKMFMYIPNLWKISILSKILYFHEMLLILNKQMWINVMLRIVSNRIKTPGAQQSRTVLEICHQTDWCTDKGLLLNPLGPCCQYLLLYTLFGVEDILGEVDSPAWPRLVWLALLYEI